MKTAFLFFFLFPLMLMAGNPNRQDFDIPKDVRTTIPVGGSLVSFRINYDFNYVYSNSQRFVKVTGFDTNDTNRTLIYNAGNHKVYFVDSVGTPVNKVRLAVIQER